jgi:hypothetical protein
MVTLSVHRKIHRPTASDMRHINFRRAAGSRCAVVAANGFGV